MSNCVLNRTFEQSQQKNAHRLTLIALADRANDEGLCDPGFKDIAKRAGVSERQAKRLVAQLEESGELYIGHGGGRCSTNLYFITVGLSLDQIEATLKKHFNLGDRTPAAAQAVYAKIEAAGLYVPKYEPKGVTRGNNSVTDDTLSHSQNGDIQGIDAPLNGVTDDTVYTNGDENGVIQGQETVSSIPPEPIKNLLIDSPIESTESPQQPKTRTPANSGGRDGYLDDLSDLPEIRDKARQLSPEQQEVWKLYEANISVSESPITVEAIWDTYDGLTPPPGETKLMQFREAVQAACDNGSRRWAYVRGVLDNITEAGGIMANREQYANRKAGNPNGRNNQDRQSGRSQAAAKRIPASDGLSRLAAIASGE